MLYSFNILFLFRCWEWHQVLVKYSRWWRIPFPSNCTALITMGQVEGSKRNCTISISPSGPGVRVVWCLIRGRRSGLSARYSDQWDIDLDLMSARTGHLSSMCSSVPRVLGCPVIRQSWQKPWGLELDQYLALWSVTYLPDSMVATVVALLTSWGLSAMVHMGWGLLRDMNEGWK